MWFILQFFLKSVMASKSLLTVICVYLCSKGILCNNQRMNERYFDSKLQYEMGLMDEDEIEWNMQEDEVDNFEIDEVYSDREQVIALILSVYVGIVGADRFYIGDYVRASIKLSLALIVIFCSPFAIFWHSCDGLTDAIRPNLLPDTTDVCMGKILTIIYVSYIGFTAVLLAWWISDIAMFAFNMIPDANGQTLNPM